MGQIRTFIAIELPPEAKTFLAAITEKLRPGRETAVKWVAPDGIHLTLKFLGDIPEQQVVDITNAMGKVANETFPFDLKLEGTGAFPDLKAPRVVWVGIGGDVPELANLQRQIEMVLVPLGFATEKRAFSAHLTLGRVRETATSRERLDIGKALASIDVEGTLPFQVTSISLMESKLSSRGATYKKLANSRLTGSI